MGGPLFALIFAGLIILILLIVGQLFYNKFPRVSLTIWGLTVLLLAYFIYSFNTANSSFGDKVKNEFVGTFKIDIYQSNFDSTDLKNYSDLLLNVKGDKTFTFSYKTPFFKDTIGYWQHMDDGDISWTEISVGDKNLMQANIEADKWVFSSIELISENNKNVIVFVRQ
jgi:hypothetical protein